MPELKVRMKEPLRKSIQDAALTNDTSMNSEMVSRLEQSFRDDRLESILTKMLAPVLLSAWKKAAPK